MISVKTLLLYILTGFNLGVATIGFIAGASFLGLFTSSIALFCFWAGKLNEERDAEELLRKIEENK